MFIFFFSFCNINEESKKILSEYKLGIEINSIPIKKYDVLFEFEVDSNSKIEDINIIKNGYAHPKKYLKKNQKLVMVFKGEYIVYLYFNEEGKLVDKEIVGS
jgi:hypothetical protein